MKNILNSDLKFQKENICTSFKSVMKIGGKMSVSPHFGWRPTSVQVRRYKISHSRILSHVTGHHECLGAGTEHGAFNDI